MLWSTIFPVFSQVTNVNPEGVLPFEKQG